MLMKSKPTFAIDSMLGKLAKKLRLLGFDSFYSSNILDNNLLNIAKNEGRILISKDTQLCNISKKQNMPTIKLEKEQEIDQLVEINNAIPLGKCIISGDISRCPICNDQLQTIEKDQIKSKVPKGVMEHNEKFWMCKCCKKIYWEGSHIKNLKKFTTILNEQF